MGRLAGAGGTRAGGIDAVKLAADYRVVPGLQAARGLKFIVGEAGPDTEAYESRSRRALCAEQSRHQLGDAHRSG
ncbi:hypothetical protein QFZ42_004865 [Variovorax paradoxus]|jgi:hypothetical protein|nr:hypothetical protein [Variovorax paradoxus]